MPARLVRMNHADMVELMGPTVQFVSPPGDDDAPCLLVGTIPPGGVVPLHSHADPETFLVVSGEMEALTERGEGFEWVRIAPGDAFHVPGNAKHAFRNVTRVPAVSHITTTSRLARFFREVGTPADPGRDAAAPDEIVQRFLAVSARYGYWNATPEENAAVGISLPAG